METKLKTMAKMAYKRLASGFWKNERNKRKQSLAILQNKGIDTVTAQNYFVENTKQQIAAEYNQEDEALYQRVKKVFLLGENENALTVLMDQEQMKTMDDSTRQRYIFNLSAKLQEFSERFAKERQFNCDETTMSV